MEEFVDAAESDGDVPRVRLRPEIAALGGYRQGRAARPGGYKLSSNENPFAPIPAVLEAIAASSLNRYPDGAASVLRDRLAERHGVSADRIQIGAGSVALLHQFADAAIEPGGELLFAWRSFEHYPTLATVARARAVAVPVTADGRHDLPAMAAAVTDATRLVIVCSPNNPTGPAVHADEFEAFMAAVPRSVLVVLDEAYVEFVTDPDAVRGEHLVDAHPNLVVLRTFSKAWGLAGLRLGYAVGPAYVLDAVRAAAVPLSVIEPAQRAGLAALDHAAELHERVHLLVTQRDRVREALLEQGWAVPDAQGNFVWLPTLARTDEIADAFADGGIVVRAFSGDGIRISIGEPEAVEPLLRIAGSVVGTRSKPVVARG